LLANGLYVCDRSVYISVQRMNSEIPEGRSAWLEKKGEVVTKWIVAGKDGIYIFERERVDEEPVVRIISTAVIKKVKPNRNSPGWFCTVEFSDSIKIGTMQEILEHIEREYGLDNNYRLAVIRLLRVLSEKES